MQPAPPSATRAQTPFRSPTKWRTTRGEGKEEWVAAILGEPTRSSGRHSPRSRRSSPRCGRRARRAGAPGDAAGGRVGDAAGLHGAPRLLGAEALDGRQERLGPDHRPASARLAFCRLWGRQVLGPAWALGPGPPWVEEAAHRPEEEWWGHQCSEARAGAPQGAQR